MPRIINFGSLNIDHVYRVSHLVCPGETVACKEYKVFSGGKGLNQSIALARAGSPIFHAGCIGSDGEVLLDILRQSGVNTDLIVKTSEPSGHAIIQVDDQGENCIILYPGANGCITPELIDSVIKFAVPGDFLLLQNEINHIQLIMEKAAEKGLVICMNLAPFDRVSVSKLPLNLLHILFINEIEGAGLSGESLPDAIVDVLTAKFPYCAIVLTLGKDGAVYGCGKDRIKISVPAVAVVDTTAAGDAFTGYFLEAYRNGKTPEQCLNEANMAAAVTVSRSGAANSIPCRGELKL